MELLIYISISILIWWGMCSVLLDYMIDSWINKVLSYFVCLMVLLFAAILRPYIIWRCIAKYIKTKSD